MEFKKKSNPLQTGNTLLSKHYDPRTLEIILKIEAKYPGLPWYERILPTQNHTIDFANPVVWNITFPKIELEKWSFGLSVCELYACNMQRELSPGQHENALYFYFAAFGNFTGTPDPYPLHPVIESVWDAYVDPTAKFVAGSPTMDTFFDSDANPSPYFKLRFTVSLRR